MLIFFSSSNPYGLPSSLSLMDDPNPVLAPRLTLHRIYKHSLAIFFIFLTINFSCVVCQIIDPVNPTQAPAFTVPVKVTEALLRGTRRKYSWKDHLVEMLGAGDLRPNLVGLEDPELEGLFL